MATSDLTGAIWVEIERSESYLVCSMYKEAASLASTVLKNLCENSNTANYEMLESAGMVLVQSLQELGGKTDVLNELELSFGAAASIPVQVLLTGACFEVQKGSSNVRKFLEEFLSKWNLVNEELYVLVGSEDYANHTDYSDERFVLRVDEYLEVVEVYLLTFMKSVSNDMDLAISWVNKAALPMEKRQGLLRRLHSLGSLKATDLSKASPSSLLQKDNESYLPSKQSKKSEGPSKAVKPGDLPNGENATRESVLKLSKQMEPCFWWYRTFTLKIGSVRLVISNGKIMLSCLILLLYYVLQRKKYDLKRIVRRRALAIKNGFVDLWQLAFSYQVNPLAAVQPLPTTTRASYS